MAETGATFHSFIISSSFDFLAHETSEDAPAFLILAYYHLSPLIDPQAEVKSHFAFFGDRDYKGRIYLSKQGINGTMSAPVQEAYAYIQWLMQDERFQGIEFKAHEYPEHAFARLTVKTRKELVAIGCDIDLEKRAVALSPSQWKKMLEEESDYLLLDVRNDYEWQLGHFEGAIAPPCETFKDFKRFVGELQEKIDTKKTKVMMYCTGGIRCEFFSALLKQEGIENVFSLDGGLIKYGAEEKSAHWKGSLFVFDDRMSIPLSDEKAPVISKCYHCGTEAENYYNCANIDCNTLFICCSSCLTNFKGCCKEVCAGSCRVRPLKLVSKPFRRWYTYANTKEELNSLSGGCSDAH